MKFTSTFIVCAAALTASLSAQAGVRAVDVPRISNGGTGFIGATESANVPRTRFVPTRDFGISRIPAQAGEASTMINGQPNGNPDQVWVAATAASTTQVMGASSEWSARSHPLWGTPD